MLVNPLNPYTCAPGLGPTLTSSLVEVKDNNLGTYPPTLRWKYKDKIKIKWKGIDELQKIVGKYLLTYYLLTTQKYLTYLPTYT